MTTHSTHKLIPRPPVIAIMGHIDHGKSTLLDYIRKSNIVDKEAGGITQQIAAYEVTHTRDGKEQRITFLDTPGHEAFAAMRSQGVKVADIAVLVVSAEDGVKPQTIEAMRSILTAGIPYIVAINKIDRPEANIERTKQSLVEHEIYIEGYGGTTPAVEISAKTGQGIPELLDMMLLVAELEELTGDPSKSAEGVVIETKLDKKKGLSATLVIKDGTLNCGTVIVADTALSPGRMMESFLGKKITSASFSTPVMVIGWSELPEVGSHFTTFTSKKEAEEQVQKRALEKAEQKKQIATAEDNPEKIFIPLIVKVNVSGSLEAVEHEIAKIQTDKVNYKIIQKGIGDISETDIKIANGTPGSVIVGFNTRIDNLALNLAERLGIELPVFEVIYKLSEYLAFIITQRTPTLEIEEVVGTAKIVRLFSHVKDRQVIGGKVEKGKIKLGSMLRIMRREAEIGRGRLKELQQQKERTSEVEEGREFGAMVESKIEIAPGDRIESIEIVKK